MPRGWNQQRGGFDNGLPRRGNRGRPNNGGRGRGRSDPLAHNSTPFVSAPQLLFESSVSADVEVFDFNNMPTLDALNGQKANFRGRGRGRGGLHRAIPRGAPVLPVNPHPHPVFVPRATNGSHNAPRGRVRGAFPLYDPDYLDPYTHPNHSPSTPLKSKGGGLGFDNSPGPNSKPIGSGRWDPATSPFLKPIKFVRAKERLFETDPDELLQAHELKLHPSDDLDPQVDMMEDIIAHNEQPLNRVSPLSEEEANIKMTTRVEMGFTKKSEAARGAENGMGDAANGLHPKVVKVNQGVVVPALHSETERPVEHPGLFYFHSTPQVLPKTSPGILFDRVTEFAIGQSYAEDQEDDEIILFPSKTRSGIAPSPPSVVPPVVIREEAISVMKATTPPNDMPINIPTSFSIGNPSTRSTFVPVRMRKEAKRARRIERNKQKAKESKFFDREKTVITGDAEGCIDGSPRVGDSDLDWGSDGPPQAVIGGVFVEKAKTSESDGGGMDVDDGLDEIALAQFAMGVTNPQHLGIYDLEGAEDSDEEDGDGIGSVIGVSAPSGFESSEDSDEWTDEDEVDQTPDMEWQSRLTKMREKVKGKQRATSAGRDEDYLAYLEDLLDGNADILEGRDRKEKKSLFRAIQNGDFDDTPVSGRHRTMKHVPVGLQEQWEHDRLKKAERKRLREEQRKQGLLTKKMKKKDKTNSQSLDLESIEPIMRDLVYDISCKSVTLPPLPKEIREQVHRMALAFNLKSKSEGSKKNGQKAMVISRSGKTGTSINEFKVSKILKKPRTGGGGGGAGGHSKVAEGEVIGHKAAKISQDNVGYRLLAQMGWSEGDKIGLEGRGIDAPITAVMKISKLGLGAKR